MSKKYKVTEDAQRPRMMNGKCFYCHQDIGDYHRDICILIKKKVLVRAIVEYEVEVPAFWDGEMVDFHRNLSSWCRSNIVEELIELRDRMDGCLCPVVSYKYICDKSEEYLKEK